MVFVFSKSSLLLSARPAFFKCTNAIFVAQLCTPEQSGSLAKTLKEKEAVNVMTK